MNQGQGASRFMGVLLILLGLLVLAAQTFTTFVTLFILGVVLVIGGILELIHAFSRKEERAVYNFLGGIINIILGGFIIFFPDLSAVSLTLLIALGMIALGAYRLISSFSQEKNRGWNILGGALILILGLMILSGWPASGLFIIGLFIGIELIISGITLTFAAPATTVSVERNYQYAHDIKREKSKTESQKKSDKSDQDNPTKEI